MYEDYLLESAGHTHLDESRQCSQAEERADFMIDSLEHGDF